MLGRFTAEEIADSTEDGRIVVTCEFCGTKYEFDPAQFADATGVGRISTTESEGRARSGMRIR
jgi:hypothetical protein